MDLSHEDIEHLIAEIQDYQLSNGSLIKRLPLDGTSTSRPVGVSVVPSPFDRHLFEQAVELQRTFNELYMKVSADVQYLQEALEPVLAHDPFVAALWDVWCQASVPGNDPAVPRQPVTCAIFRSDYMAHTAGPEPGLRQVEMNTISVAGAVHAEVTANLGKHLNRTAAVSNEVPECDNTASLVKLLSQAINLYSPATSHKCGVLMIVQPYNFNTADERPIEYGLLKSGHPCIRCDWQDVLAKTIRLSDGTLLFSKGDGRQPMEIGLVYYRAGHEAREYDDFGKQTRLHLEKSRAIKCPDILTHLTTFKFVQQTLTTPNAVERFLAPAPASRVRSTFMPMFALNSPSGHRIVQDVVEASSYILKPNLEGGGNNVYGQEIPAFVQRLHKREWGKYVLMRKIEPPDVNGILLTSQGIYNGPAISELGILGTGLWRRDSSQRIEMLSNELAGWTFKTKPAHVDEMSVVKGYGVFDCPRLQ